MPDKIIVNVMNEAVRLIEEACDPLPARSVAFLENDGYIPGTLRLYQMPGHIHMYEGQDWNADPSDGQINLSEPLPPDFTLSADYRILGASH